MPLCLVCLESAFGYDDMIAQLVLDVLRCDRNDVRTRYGSQPDEVVHGFISDDEGRVAMWIVLKELSASDHKGIKINADFRKNGRKSAI